MAFEKGENNFDVVIVGAGRSFEQDSFPWMHRLIFYVLLLGISGINFAYRLQERNPNLSFIILEDRHEIGGTWSLFQYPGMFNLDV